MRPYISILSFFPYSSVLIVLILLLFKSESLFDTLNFCSDYLQLSQKNVIILILVMIVLSMLCMQCIFNAVIYFFNYREEQSILAVKRENERNALIELYEAMEVRTSLA